MRPRRYFFLFLLLLISSPVGAQNDDSWKLYDDTGLARIDITVDPAKLQWIYTHPQSDSEHCARFHFRNALIDESLDSIGFRLRGNTSRESAKKSFKVSFNSFISGREFHGVDKLNLNGEHNDPSIIRSKLCFDLYHDIGRIASRASHVQLYINGRYYGLYISVEQVDDEFLSKNFADDSGNLWKCLYPADLKYKGDDPAIYKNLRSGDRPVYELSTNEQSADFQPLARFIRVLNQTPSAALPDSLESLLDVPGVLKYFAMNLLVGSWDDYWSLMNNYYLYYDPSQQCFTLIPYDYDNTFGVDWANIDWSVADPYNFPKVAGGSRPLAERLLAFSPYRDLYTHFLQFYNFRVYPLANWENRIDRLKALITSAALADSFRTLDYGFTGADFNNSYSAGSYSNQHVKFGLKQFIALRSASIARQLRFLQAAPSIYRVDVSPHHPTSRDSIHIDAACFASAGLRQVSVWFTPRGAASAQEIVMKRQPVADSKKAEEADRWQCVLPPLGPNESISFRILAVDSLEQTAWYPRSRTIPIAAGGGQTSPLVINEFMADNGSAYADPAGEFDDWMELYNSGTIPQLLTGLHLTDKRDNLDKWRFSQTGLYIQPGEHLIVWCDEQPQQQGLHTNFKLSASGEFLALVGVDGFTVLDSISFGAQTKNISFGRYPDGQGAWQLMPPTPDAANQKKLKVETNESQPDIEFSVYPNPFNLTTILRFDLPGPGLVKVDLYNALGQLLGTLVDQPFAGGRFQRQLDGRGLPSGIFFCSLQAGRFRKVVKILVIK